MPKRPHHSPTARGTNTNPAGRFEALTLDTDFDDGWDMSGEDDDFPEHKLRTQFFNDHNKSILTYNNSPDLPRSVMLNPYRGCEHGCVYCFARPSHEYLGLSAGLDFESKIFVKKSAPTLLRKTLAAKRYRPQAISISGNTDPYQPIERRLQITRQCLKVLAEFRHPVGIITKNHLVTRDIDILQELAQHQAIAVNISLTSLDSHLIKSMEPRTSRPKARLRAIEKLSAAGIPVNVLMGPIIPGLTDHEIPILLKSAADAGARSAGYTMLRLSHGLRELFVDWLEHHYPLKKSRVLGRIKDVRGGKLNDTRWGLRQLGEGPYADHIATIFSAHKKKFQLNRPITLNDQAFRQLSCSNQLDLFT